MDRTQLRGTSAGLCPLFVTACAPFAGMSRASHRNWWLRESDVLVVAKNSPGFAAGDHYMLHTLDPLHVLRAFEG